MKGTDVAAQGNPALRAIGISVGSDRIFQIDHGMSLSKRLLTPAAGTADGLKLRRCFAGRRQLMGNGPRPDTDTQTQQGGRPYELTTEQKEWARGIGQMIGAAAGSPPTR